MKKFSIIVPIYKVENYIEECINSVINQQYNNYELILIDDGSPDCSGDICDQYQNRYPNVKVIHKNNGGLSEARNTGLKVAKGEYIIFLDGDDILSKDCLKKIDTVIQKNDVDLLSCNFCLYGENKEKEKIYIKNINKIEDYIKCLHDIPWAAWRNIYKKSIIDRYQLKFTRNLTGAEDCDFFMKYIEKSNMILYCNVDIINYRYKREGSITDTISFDTIIGQLNVFSACFYNFMNKNNDIIYKFFAKKYLNTITTIYNIKDRKQKQIINENIRKNKIILKYANGLKYIIAKACWTFFGYFNGSMILKCLNSKV